MSDVTIRSMQHEEQARRVRGTKSARRGRRRRLGGSSCLAMFAFVLGCSFCVSTSFLLLTPSSRWTRSSRKSLVLTRLYYGNEDGTIVTLNSTSRSGFDSSWIDAIKGSVDIIEVVESYRLGRFERNSVSRATAICPFHDDKSPSLSVDGERRLFKCFGCGVGGDVFAFVREHANLKGEDMSYMQSVRYVDKTWGSGHSTDYDGTSGPHISNEDRKRLLAVKERICLANAAAASFYADCLLRPSAGAVRAYVKARGLTPGAVRTFGLGFAPDAYFNRDRTEWGEGSLVKHLDKLNFTAREILDSGLAVQTKDSKLLGSNQSASGSFANFVTVAFSCTQLLTGMSVLGLMSGDNLNYTCLIDRFRHRLVVPILDGSGSRVIGLGGRTLPLPTIDASNSFKFSKYLNSPESVVFQKKRILFGESLARAHIKSSSGDLVIVEGYMDVIALWSVGLKESVACMGTALTREQLVAAATIVKASSGRMVLCLDNDAAGLAAVERLCSGGVLKEVTEKQKVAICIANLPDGVKDPDEFISIYEKQDRNESLDHLFRSEVVQPAEDWATWFVRRIIATYNPDAPRGKRGSFGNVFDRVADHLALSMTAGDRTRVAYEVTSTLAAILAKEANATCVSEAVRSQLESDLIASSARIANARDAVRIRTEAAIAANTNVSVSQVMRALSRGEGPRGIELVASNSMNLTRWQSTLATQPRPAASRRLSATGRREVGRKRVKQGRSFRQKTVDNSRLSLTPHFAGFRFSNKDDADWLIGESPSTSGSFLLGRSSRSAFTSKSALASRTRDGGRIVYFNSNEYHGEQYLTEVAVNAGYRRGSFERDASFVEKGIGSLLKCDVDRLACVAEDGLLRILIRHYAARTALKNLLDARKAVGSMFEVKWSCDSKAWLFACLMDVNQSLPESTGEIRMVREFLSSLPSCPSLAFSTNSNHTARSEDIYDVPTSSAPNGGSLEHLFLDHDNVLDLVPSNEKRVELEVEQHYCTLLRTSTTKKIYELQLALEDVLRRMSKVTPAWQDGDESVSDHEDLKSEFQRLTLDLQASTQILQSLAKSAELMAARQVRESSMKLSEGRISKTLQADLTSKMDELMSILQQLERPPEFDRFRENTQSKETLQEALDRIERDWGKWCDDDFDWSHPSGQSATKNKISATRIVVDQLQASKEWNTTVKTL